MARNRGVLGSSSGLKCSFLAIKSQNENFASCFLFITAFQKIRKIAFFSSLKSLEKNGFFERNRSLVGQKLASVGSFEIFFEFTLEPIFDFFKIFDISMAFA